MTGRPRVTARSLCASVPLWLTLSVVVSGCRQDMHDQPRYEAFEATGFFEDGLSARPPVEGTVARGQLNDDEHLYTGKVGGEIARSYPMRVTRPLLDRGRERFGIYCTPCHGLLGMGDGMIVQRGFKKPTSFHDERLRQEPPGYFFDVMTNGFGAMASYAPQVGPEDRWAIAAYIQVLQLSQNATIDAVPAPERRILERIQ